MFAVTAVGWFTVNVPVAGVHPRESVTEYGKSVPAKVVKIPVPLFEPLNV